MDIYSLGKKSCIKNSFGEEYEIFKTSSSQSFTSSVKKVSLRRKGVKEIPGGGGRDGKRDDGWVKKEKEVKKRENRKGGEGERVDKLVDNYKEQR